MSATPAQKQAGFLATLFAHLVAHPNLQTAIVHTGGALQLTTAESPATVLADWADTLPGHIIQAKIIDGEAYVHVRANLGGQDVDVWDTVPGLAEVLATGQDQRTVAITAQNLRIFAATGSITDGGL